MERILNLAISIPLPSKDSFVQEDFINDENINMSEETDIVSIKEERQLLVKSESIESNVDKKLLQQSINLEFSFEINLIDFTLTEEKHKYFDFISFQIT